MKRWIPVGDFKIGNEEKKEIMEVVESGKISEGRKLVEFERKFAEYVGTKHSIGVNSGTSALICSLTALKEMFGTEKTRIITTPVTYIATVNSIVLTGFN
ncbi:MAG: DegT/DnrJ/EryC1/StrS family aminotransferase, partial [Thermoplasmata archaeon]|nr:DegT/DnrJ/EryC1/StrS family aminotransferase [Thermoplasmata archaeon]